MHSHILEPLETFEIQAIIKDVSRHKKTNCRATISSDVVTHGPNVCQHVFIHWWFYIILFLFMKFGVNVTHTGMRMELNTTDRIHCTIKILQFSQYDIVFSVIQRNLPLGSFTSLKLRTVCRASSKGILVFAVAY